MSKCIVTAGGMLIFCASLGAQVQNVNIGGSFSGSFLLSSTQDEYQIAGSPYLSENWMYGTIEMNSEVVRTSSIQSARRRDLLEQKIHRCDLLIEKLSDPRYQTRGISLILEETMEEGEVTGEEVSILNGEFESLDQLTDEFQSKLLGTLTLLRARYESQLEQIEKINGLFRYNLYSQEFEMIYDRDTFAIVAPFNVRNISLSNMKFIYGFYIQNNLSKVYLGSSYFQVLNDGECKLLVRHAVKISGGDAPVTYNWANASGDAFVPSEKLYYQEHDGSEILPLKRRKRLFRELFGEQYENVMSYMKAENLNLKKNGDLARLFTYYNSLIT